MESVGSESSRPGLRPFFADGGGMDDGPNQDPMVPSSRAIVVPGLLSQRRYSTQPDRRILVGSHGLLRPRVPCRPVMRAPNHNRLSCGAIWRRNRRIEDTYHVLTGKRMFENGSYKRECHNGSYVPSVRMLQVSHWVPFLPRLEKGRIGGFPARHGHRKWDFTCLAICIAPDSLPTTLEKSVHELVFRCAANVENRILS
ncbi:hypothetical protein M5K25_007274 [Dendrobium thyrsiflorum]|uniref:Uncharacterized protein n=1 Tax=Dendrobium thyrsiflorum TaxID=117978 RepID=A0ABD0VDS8_DENTH